MPDIVDVSLIFLIVGWLVIPLSTVVRKKAHGCGFQMA
jgi:hypothetical protein